MKTATNRFGHFSYLPNEEYIGACLQTGRPWEEKLIDTISVLLEEDMVVLDGGAHIGCFSIPCAPLCKRIYAIEMQQPIYNLLLHNLYLNEVSNVVPMCLALGPREGLGYISGKVPDGMAQGSELVYNSSHPVNYGGVNLGVGQTEVEMTTIDALNLKAQFIKLDLEGWEPLVVKGGLESIIEYKPIILYERNWKRVSPEAIQAYKLKDEDVNFPFAARLKAAGYEDPYPVNKGSDFLLLPRHDLSHLMSSHITDYMGNEVKLVFDRDTGYTCYIGERGPYRLYSYAPKRLLLIVGEHFFRGSIHQGMVVWSNNTTWKIE